MAEWPTRYSSVPGKLRASPQVMGTVTEVPEGGIYLSVRGLRLTTLISVPLTHPGSRKPSLQTSLAPSTVG